MDTGYIKLFRKMTEWEWYDDLPTFRLFIHLLLRANYQEKKWHGMIVERGCYITSISNLATETKLSAQQVRTAINRLISTNEITKSSTSKYTIIKVLNYDCYQGVNKVDNKQATNEQQATNNQSTTTKERKESKKERSILKEEKIKRRKDVD